MLFDIDASLELRLGLVVHAVLMSMEPFNQLCTISLSVIDCIIVSSCEHDLNIYLRKAIILYMYLHACAEGVYMYLST